MKIQIKNRWDDSVIFETDAKSVGDAVRIAIEAKQALISADLRIANLSGADLRSANLRSANLSDADLRSADLRSANLSGADLRSANLRSANLSDADLRSADLRSANLSGCKNIPLPSAFLSQFKADADGILVYRATFGSYTPPDHWEFAPGKFLTEIPNPDRCTECGCGVSFATLEWVKANHPTSPIWLCRIRWADLADVVVPFNTDGKARCARLELLEAL